MEGLKNKTLKKDLHLKACSTFEQVTREALYLVDNCKAYGEVSEAAESIASGTSSVKSDTSIKKDLPAAPTTEQMIEEITKRIQQAQVKELEKEKPREENTRVPVPTENGSLSVRTQRKSWKAKRKRMKVRRAESQAAIQEELQEVKQQLQQDLESKKVEQNNQPRKELSGGSVLVDKVLEPLDALSQQWEARLNNTQTLEQRWLTYPYLEIETKRLEMCKDLIRAAQALMEPNVNRAPEQEVLIQKEIEKQGVKELEPVTGPKADTNLSLEHRVVPNTTDEAMTMEVMSILEVEEPWPQSLWETIRNRKDESATLQSTPIPKVVLNNEFYPGDIQSLYGDAGMEVFMDSKPPSLKTLPSFIGSHEAKSVMRVVPSQQRATPKMIDSKGLQEMLSTPVTCMITLSELLKIRPHLWEEMGKHLETKGIKIPIHTDPPREVKQSENQQKSQPVPINKVGDHCEGEEGVQFLGGLSRRAYGAAGNIKATLLSLLPSMQQFGQEGEWYDMTSFKTTLGYTPYQLVFGKEAILPIEVKLASLRVLVCGRDRPTQAEHQNQKFDEGLKDKGLKKKMLVLRYNNRFDTRQDKKFMNRWKGPFLIYKKYTNGNYRLQEISGKLHKTRVNGWRLKPFFQRFDSQFMFHAPAGFEEDEEEQPSSSNRHKDSEMD
ncbi:hypothetical protein L7F22_028527 [Adiantum nelumboides]|nr:hypothetical protein [Adiantum nelumboides]